MKTITVSREFGSGGRELGKRLADVLGVAYYDKEIISKIAENLKLDEQYIENHLERDFTVNFPYTFRCSFSTPFYAMNQVVDMLVEQHKIIRTLAKREDCVIVGRGADAVLHDMGPYNIFVYADMAAKKERCRNRASPGETLSERELERRIRQIDKARAASYDLVSGYPWGDKRAYHLCVNTTGLDIHQIVPHLAAFVKIWFERKDHGDSII